MKAAQGHVLPFAGSPGGTRDGEKIKEWASVSSITAKQRHRCSQAALLVLSPSRHSVGCKIKVVSSLDSLILIFISAEIIGYCEETLRCWV